MTTPGGDIERTVAEYTLTQAVLKYLQDFSRDSAADILFDHSVTAIKSAREQDALAADAGYIDIDITETSTGRTLHVEHNGTGFTEQELQAALTLRCEDQLSILAVPFLLTGADGAYVYATQSPDPTAEPHAGVVTTDGFRPFASDEAMPQVDATVTDHGSYMEIPLRAPPAPDRDDEGAFSTDEILDWLYTAELSTPRDISTSITHTTPTI